MLQQKFVFLIVSPEGISLEYLPRREFLVHEIWGPSMILEIVLQGGFVLSLQLLHIFTNTWYCSIFWFFPVWLMWNASCGFCSLFLNYSWGWASFLVFCGHACFLLFELPLTIIFFLLEYLSFLILGGLSLQWLQAGFRFPGQRLKSGWRSETAEF